MAEQAGQPRGRGCQPRQAGEQVGRQRGDAGRRDMQGLEIRQAGKQVGRQRRSAVRKQMQCLEVRQAGEIAGAHGGPSCESVAQEARSRDSMPANWAGVTSAQGPCGART